MEIILAENHGFCYGVKRAVEMANEAANGAGKSYTLGPIIHNPQVVGRLESKGVKPIDEVSDIDSGTMIIRSHGVGPAIYEEAENRGLPVIDATCPHVQKAQRDAKSVVEEGLTLIILGEKKHPEVKSINLWAGNKGIIVETEEDAKNIQFVEKIGVVVQTTFSQFKFQSIIKILEQKSKDQKIFKTICQATEERQNSAVALAKEVDLMIVVGGKNSGNTTRLAEVCRDVGCTTYHIETATEIQMTWLKDVTTVGVTAGASTPDWIIKEVIQTMENFAELTAYVESGAIVNGNQYTWFNYNPTTRKVIYAQRANQIPVMDGSSQIIFTLNANNQVISYEQTFAGNVEKLGNNRSLITSQKAMEVLYLAGRIPTRSTISVVRLSYYKSLALKDLSIYSPAWYVEFKQADGQMIVRRVDAIRGTVLTNEATETVNTGTTQ